MMGRRVPGSFICIPIRRTTSWLPVEDTFYLVNLAWDVPFHIVRLESGGDILRIPPGTFHRSVSDPEGSVVLNQAVRAAGVSLLREFRVYNSARIPALMAATVAGAPKPLLHGMTPALQAA